MPTLHDSHSRSREFPGILLRECVDNISDDGKVVGHGVSELNKDEHHESGNLHLQEGWTKLQGTKLLYEFPSGIDENCEEFGGDDFVLG